MNKFDKPFKILPIYDEGKIKDLFEYYENQIETQFDFSKYQLLKSKEKSKHTWPE